MTSAQTSSAAPSWSWRNRCPTRPRRSPPRQVVHGGLGRRRAVLLGEQRGRQLRLVQLVPSGSAARSATPGGAATHRPGRAVDWAASPCRSSRRRACSVSCSPSDSRRARSGTSAAPTDTSARYADSCVSSRPIAASINRRPPEEQSRAVCRGGKQPRHKPASGHHRRTPGLSAKVTPPQSRLPPATPSAGCSACADAGGGPKVVTGCRRRAGPCHRGAAGRSPCGGGIVRRPPPDGWFASSFEVSSAVWTGRGRVAGISGCPVFPGPCGGQSGA